MTVHDQHTRRRPGRASFLAVIACLILFPTSAVASGEGQEFHRTAIGIATRAFYHEPSDRYFQLVKPDDGNFNWGKAASAAARLAYEGRRGRLAIIDEPSIHSFLVSHFQHDVRMAWIGLRYMCANRSLVWIDGSSLDSGFAPWDRSWSYLDAGGCGSAGSFMAVYYTREMRWQAVTWIKHWGAMIVEYPQSDE